MRVLLIADEWNARRERDLIHRVEIGLLAEADRVIYAYPERLTRKQAGPFVSTIPFQSRGSGLTASVRASRLVEDMHAAFSDLAAGPVVDVVHAFGHWAWPVARRVAAAHQAALCVELNSTRSVHRAMPLLRRMRRGGADGPRLAFSVGDLTLLACARDVLKRGTVHLTPWGVHQDSEALHERRASTRSVVVIADPWHARAVRPVLRALSTRFPDTHVFLDEMIARSDPSIWADARSLGMLDRLDIAVLPEANRPLALGCDALVVAGRSGLLRSLILDAFASRTPVVALEDPELELLTAPAAAVMPSEDTADGWGEALELALDMESARRRDLLDRAQRFADEDRSPTGHIRSVVRVYRELMKDRPLPFAGAGSDAGGG